MLNKWTAGSKLRRKTWFCQLRVGLFEVWGRDGKQTLTESSVNEKDRSEAMLICLWKC